MGPEASAKPKFKVVVFFNIEQPVYIVFCSRLLQMLLDASPNSDEPYHSPVLMYKVAS